MAHDFASVSYTHLDVYKRQMLDPTNSNIPVTIDDITSVAVNGRDLGFDGYLLSLIHISFRWALSLPVTWPRRPERSPGH